MMFLKYMTMQKEKLRIVFFGTPEFAVASLDRLYTDGYNIVGVVTMPDKPAGRGHKMLFSDVKKYALEKNLPLLQPVKLKDPEFVEALRGLQADLFIVIAFRMLPEVVWTMPPLGTFNLHASLLPSYRGAAPINWAVMNGDTETGVTTFFLKHEIDTGDVIRQERISIGPDENVGSVHDRLMSLGADLTADTVAHIIAGDLKPVSQEMLATDRVPSAAPKIFTETCRIDWTRPAARLHDFVRGLSPYPCSWTEVYAGDEKITELKVIKARVAHEAVPEGDPGQFVVVKNHLYVRCGEGALELLEVRPSGKRPMTASDYWRGVRLPDDSADLILMMR